MNQNITIVPEITPLTEPYWRAAAEGKLYIQECTSCQAVWHPPQPFCPRCQSCGATWRPASGRGTLWSYTIIHHAVHPAVENRTPYNVALVRLEEGPLLITAIDSPDEQLQVGAAVTVAFSPIPRTELALPIFVVE